MRFKKILLVNPPCKAEMGGNRPTAGLGYLSEVLLAKGIDHQVIDMRLGYKEKHLIKVIKQYRPDLIAFSLFTLGYRDSYKLIQKVRQLDFQFKILVGGPHVSTMRSAVLSECQEVDYGIFMEGEESLVELCFAKTPIETIHGLIFRKREEIIVNSERNFISDLDKIPFPRYTKFELNKYVPEKFIITSRGCPYQCTYCAAKPSVGSKIRLRSAGDILSEIKYWYSRGYRQFNFVDDNFTFNKARIYELCDLIEQAGMKDLFLLCTNGIRADRADYKLLSRMRNIGFQCIYFGVEGGNDKILRVLKKGEKIETVKRSIKNACALGYDVGLFFLLGSPYETDEDVLDSIAIAKQYPIIRVNFYNIVPYPSTELFQWVKKKDYFLRKPEEYLNDFTGYGIEPVFETPELPREKRVEWMKKLRRLEKQITRKALTRKLNKLGFMGNIIAYLFATDFVQGLFFTNNQFRSIMEKLRYLYVKKFAGEK